MKKKIIAIMAITILALMVSCGGGGSKTAFIVATADSNGQINISWSVRDIDLHSVSITTNLPAPNDSFTLTQTESNRSITGLEPGQKVNVSASVSSSSVRLELYMEGSHVAIRND